MSKRKDRFDRDLIESAEQIVEEAVASLPDDIREASEGAPVRFELEMDAHWIDEGIDPENLGLFSGPSMLDPDCPECIEPPLITLFLYNIWDYAEGDWDAFDAEVRRTFLHELGHYLGLEESAMPGLDLD